MINIQPGTACVKPVFELNGGGKKLARVAWLTDWMPANSRGTARPCGSTRL